MDPKVQQTSSIAYNVRNFIPFFSQCKSANELFFVAGNKKAGKSITIDLLTNKSIEEVEDETGVKQLREESNSNCIYDPIYFQSISKDNKKILFLQGFTLDQNLQSSTVNYLKAIYLKIALTFVNRVSIIVAIEQTEKQRLHCYIEHLLEGLGLFDQQNSNAVKALVPNIHLLITKTEEEGKVTTDWKDDKHYIIDQTSNRGAKALLTQFFDHNQIHEFPINVESFQEKRKKLLLLCQPQPLSSIVKEVFLKSSSIIIKQAQQKQILNIFLEFANLLENLLKYINDSILKQEYEKNLINFFKKKELCPNLLGEAVQLRYLRPQIAGKVQQYKKLKYAKDKQTLKQVLEGFNDITAQMAQIEDKPGYSELYGLTTFFLHLFTWIKVDSWDSKLLTQLLNCIKIINEKITKFQPQSKPEQKLQNLPKTRMSKLNADKKPGNKRKTPLNDFVSSLEQLNTNEEVIEFCLNFIKEKESKPNYEWSDAIYHLKMVRDLLRQFEKNKRATKTIFAEELLMLYLYNDSYHEFQRLLQMFTRDKSLSLVFAKELIPELEDRQCYESQIKVLQYMKGLCWNHEEEQIVNQLQHKAILKRNQQIFGLKQGAQSSGVRTFNLRLTLKDLLRKVEQAQNAEFQQQFTHFLRSNQFRKYIEGLSP